MKIQTTSAVAKFKCLQSDCPDTCCKGWSMQLDDATFAKYKGTELENAVDYDGAKQEIRVMKRDKSTDYCVKFTDGICAIHASKGSDLLSDACHFYPRVTRKIGSEMFMTATLSCPEITRLSLFESAGDLVNQDIERIPGLLNSYGSEYSSDESLQIHKAFFDSCNADAPAERIAARIYSAATSLQYIGSKDWPSAAPFMIKMADGKLPTPEIDLTDCYKTLQIFAGIFYATKKKMNTRLLKTLENIEFAIGARIDWETLAFHFTDNNALPASVNKWNKIKDQYNDVLKRYIAAQISFTSFPFAGIGDGIVQKARLLVFRFILIRLAIFGLVMNADNPSESQIVDAIQPLSRVIDHLGDAALTLKLMDDFGYNTDGKIRGLLWDEN